jgi:hypothetical protein
MSKTFDAFHASKSDPDRHLPSNCTYRAVNTDQQTDERVEKRLMEMDKNDLHPTNSII